MPVLVAPVAFQRVAHPDGEVAMARAAAAAGTIMCLSTLATVDAGRGGRDRRAALVPALRLARRGRHARADRAGARQRLPRARPHGRHAGASAAASATSAPASRSRPTLAVASLGRGGDRRPQQAFELISPSVTWRRPRAASRSSCRPAAWSSRAIADRRGRARSRASTAPPGSSSRTTAAASSTASPATIDALPEVVEAVDGRVEVLVDGGIRRGTDVVKALALGARAVLAGARRSGGSPSTARQARATCSSSSAPRS